MLPRMKPPEILDQLQAREALTDRQVEWLAESLLEPEMPDAEKTDLLRALSIKGETVGEIVGFVRVFLRHAIHPDLDMDEIGAAIDVCGTGGDKLDLFNISTTTMFVLAGGGITVVKHGNRGVTSKSGGADVLEALGIRIDLGPEEFSSCVHQTGAGFMFAPQPTSDKQSGGGLERSHARSYLVAGVEARYFPLRYRLVEGWVGLGGSAVVIADRYSWTQAPRVPAILGSRTVTIQTEGAAIGIQAGGNWMFAECWVAGLSMRISRWILPKNAECSPVGDCATLSGSLEAFELGLTIGYRIPL